jgi:hypothetical protein
MVVPDGGSMSMAQRRTFSCALVSACLYVIAAVLVVGAVGTATTARAQEAVVVLGLTSLEGDDEFARNLSGALRHAATAVRGWSVSERDVALSQMELVHGCESSDPACMVLIAGTLNAQRIVYGTVSRSPMGSRYEFAVSVFSFNVATGEVDQRAQHNLPSTRTDIDDLRDPAREIIAEIANTPRAGTIRVTAAPGREVRIDGTLVGTTDSGGTFVAADVATGPHEVLVQDAAAQTVTVTEGTEQLVAIATVTDGGGGGNQGPGVNWLAVALLAGAGVALVGAIYTWGRLLALSNDGEYNAYRTSLGEMGVSGEVACADSSFALATPAMSTYARGVCSEGSTLEILQYVFLGVAVAAGATGIILLVLDSSSGGGEHQEQAALRLVPSAGPNGGSLALHLTF